MTGEVFATSQTWKYNVKKILDIYIWTFILVHLTLLDLSIALRIFFP